MSHKSDKKNNKAEEMEPQEVINDVLDTDGEEQEMENLANEEMSEAEKLQAELDKTKSELEKEKKEYLFLMADFDNFRKRVMKEKADLIKNGAEKALRGLLPIVDDFERGLDATKDSDDAAAVRQGMELIYQKFVKYLADNGVKAMDTSVGTDFDAELHDAIATVPNPDNKGKIIDTTQRGYMLNDKVLRHAKVVVGE